MFAQIRGSNHLRLIPDYRCQSDCAALEIKLTEGEIRKCRPFNIFFFSKISGRF